MVALTYWVENDLESQEHEVHDFHFSEFNSFRAYRDLLKCVPDIGYAIFVYNDSTFLGI